MNNNQSLAEQISGLIIPSSPVDRQKLRDQINAGVYATQRIADEKACLDDVVQIIVKDFGYTKKMANRLIKTHFNRDKEEQVKSTEEFVTLYETIFDTDLTPNRANDALNAVSSDDE
jgi:hypothetical protein